MTIHQFHPIQSTRIICDVLRCYALLIDRSSSMPLGLHSDAGPLRLRQGRQGFYRAIKVGNQAKEDYIVYIVRNLTEIAAEGCLSEDLLRRDVGILAGTSRTPNEE